MAETSKLSIPGPITTSAVIIDREVKTLFVAGEGFIILVSVAGARHHHHVGPSTERRLSADYLENAPPSVFLPGRVDIHRKIE
jgi:hypothetical protein